MAPSRSPCANCCRMFKPHPRASVTPLGPVACTVREVASRCSASSRNVIRHDGISPFGVAIAPEYCTDAIFILTAGGFFGDAAGRGASFPICCGTLPTRSPSSCFVMYDPRLPLFFPYNYSTCPTTPPESERLCREITECKSGHPAVNRIHSLTVAARGRAGRTRAAVGHLPSENGQTHAQSNSRTIEQRKLHSPILPARISIARANQRRQHRIARARGVSVDLHRPLKEAHTCVCHGTTLRFGHN